MDDNEKEMERMQRMVQECDIPSKPEDDSKGESDLVEENKVVPGADCHETDSNDLQDELPEKVPRCGGWLDKIRIRGGKKKYSKQSAL